MTENNKLAAAEFCSAHPDELTTAIVSAYVSNNPLPKNELPDLIASVRSAISGDAAPAAHPVTASPSDIKKSITPEALISFIDGTKYKTLKRHLGKYGLTPDTYRAKYGLPLDYPMVAPNYAAKRSEIAKNLGLGIPRKQADV